MGKFKTYLWFIIPPIIGLVVGMALSVPVRRYFDEEPQPGTVTFEIQTGLPDGFQYWIYSFDEHGNSFKEKLVGSDPLIKTISVASNTINVTVFVLEADWLSCKITWKSADGEHKDYQQDDAGDDLVLPKCDWRRYYPNE